MVVKSFLEHHCFYEWSVDKLEALYATGTEKERKDAALYGLQIGVDATIDDEIDLQSYGELQDDVEQVVSAYYNDGEWPESVRFPETEKVTRPFWHNKIPETCRRRFAKSLDYDGMVDSVVAISSSGLEPGIMAAEEIGADVRTVRYSRYGMEDDTVTALYDDIADQTVVVVDEHSSTGVTKEAVLDHVEEEGATVAGFETLFEYLSENGLARKEHIEIEIRLLKSHLEQPLPLKHRTTT